MSPRPLLPPSPPPLPLRTYSGHPKSIRFSAASPRILHPASRIRLRLLQFLRAMGLSASLMAVARSLGSVVTPRPAAGSRGSAAGGLSGLSGGSPTSAAGVPVDLSLQVSQPEDDHHVVPAISESAFNAAA